MLVHHLIANKIFRLQATISHQVELAGNRIWGTDKLPRQVDPTISEGIVYFKMFTEVDTTFLKFDCEIGKFEGRAVFRYEQDLLESTAALRWMRNLKENDIIKGVLRSRKERGEEERTPDSVSLHHCPSIRRMPPHRGISLQTLWRRHI